ncbi:MAG: hypothetical protein OEZ22_09335 [Spirochaetia bacterium]|nr:hypothetical protein [Spirochaetia bacterium]
MAEQTQEIYKKLENSINENETDIIVKDRFHLLVGREIEKIAEKIADEPLLISVLNNVFEKIYQTEELPPETTIQEDDISVDEILENNVKFAVKEAEEKKYSFIRVKKDKASGRLSINNYKFLFAPAVYDVIIQNYLLKEDETEKAVNKAAQISYNMLNSLFTDTKINTEELIYKTAFQLFRTLGMGIFFKTSSEGENEFVLKKSYMVEESLNIFGKQEKPVCFFAAGYLKGAFGFSKGFSINEMIKRISVKEKNCCMVSGENKCFFELIISE